jgi:hypothetical protein
MLQPRDESWGYFQSPSGLGKAWGEARIEWGSPGAEIPAGFYSTKTAKNRPEIHNLLAGNNLPGLMSQPLGNLDAA